MHSPRILQTVRVVFGCLAACFAHPMLASAQSSPIRTLGHRRAIERSIKLLRGSVDRYPSHRDCFSCHHQAIPLFALNSARRRVDSDESVQQWVDQDRVEQILELSRRSLERQRETLRASNELDGRGLTLGYALWTSEIGNADWGDLQQELIANALATQQPDGRWRIHSTRPPAAASDAMATALVVSGIVREEESRLTRDEPDSEGMQPMTPIGFAVEQNVQNTTPPDVMPLQRAAMRARRWMLRQPPPTNTEDACGLLWIDYATAGMRIPQPQPGSPPGYGGHPFLSPDWKEFIERLDKEDAEAGRPVVVDSRRSLLQRVLDLLDQQNEDGGWGQDADRESDAYSTAIVLLLWAQTSDDYKFSAYRLPGFRKGLDYLIRTQCEDGSWHVSSRAIPVQEYFDNGDPHETDQFISIMATGWSAAVLANAWHGKLSPLHRHD